MKEILIISKTRMFNGACIGGLILPNLDSVRLLKPNGEYHEVQTNYKIGQLWNMDIQKCKVITPPHYENVLVLSRTLKGEFSKFEELIDQSRLQQIVWRGHPQNLFQGYLNWTGNARGFISQKAIPNSSTGFWIPDKNLTLEGKHYCYYDDDMHVSYYLKYVGFENPIELIPAGTRVRVSLAKWWHPSDVIMEDRCYLQVSGWY